MGSMRLDARKYLYDIKLAARLVLQFTEGKTFADYKIPCSGSQSKERSRSLAKLSPNSPSLMQLSRSAIH